MSGTTLPCLQGEDVTESGCPAACCSKASTKEARLMERKVCFILDVSTGAGGGWTPAQRLSAPGTDNQWARALEDGGGGATCRNSTVSSDSHLEISHVAV